MRTLTLFEAYGRALAEMWQEATHWMGEHEQELRRQRQVEKLEAKIHERLSAPPLCWGCRVALESYMEESSHNDTWLDVTEKEPG